MLLKVLRQRNVALLWMAQLLSTIGNWILLVGLPFYIYQLTGSLLATGAMFIAQTLPRVVLGSLLATYIDRWNLKKTLIVCDITRALLLLLLLLIHSRELVWLIYVVASVEMLISLFFDPARGALLPRLVSKSNLQYVNSLDALSTGITTMIGPALGGAFIALLGFKSIILFDSFSYILSGLLIWFIKPPPTEQDEQQELGEVPLAAKRTVRQAWIAGLRIVWQERVLRMVFIVTALAMVAQGIVSVILVAFARDVLHGGVLIYGWLLTANGIGSIIGGLIAGSLSKRFSPISLMGIGLSVVGCAVLVTALLPLLPLSLALLTLAGIAAMPYVVSAQTALQNSTVEAYRGRLLGSYFNTVSLMMLCGMGIASGLGSILGPLPLLASSGGLFFLAGLIGVFSARMNDGKLARAER